LAVTYKKEKSVKEKEQYFSQKEQFLKEQFAKALSRLNLTTLSKNETRTYNTYSKERLRTFMKDPFANSQNLRNLSRFLYRVSFFYRRLIHYNAEMIDLTAQSIIPLIDLTKEQDEDEVLTRYYKTCAKVEQMHLAREIFKLLVVAWREDTVYGYVYDDDDSFFIHILDGDYCKVSSIEDGVLNFAFDFSYFRSHEENLDYWGKEFKQKYNRYQKNIVNLRWQELDPERTICLKVNIDDPTFPFPPFGALFEALIDLADLQGIQSVKDELSIYKLLVARLETINNSNEVDDFKLDIDTALEYYNKMAEEIPPEVGFGLSPFPIDTIEFKPVDTSDVDMISNATNNLFKTSGGSEVLNSDQITGTSAYLAALLCDTEMAISSILPQIEAWMNRYLTYKIGKNHAIVKYLEVSVYTKESKKDSLLKSGQNGVPTKLAIAALDGYTPLETMSLEYLENKVLKLHKNWIPLSTSYTQSGNPSLDTDPIEGGRPNSDSLTDEGEKSRENDNK